MPDTAPDGIGWGMTRISYKRVFWLLYKLDSVEGDEIDDYVPSWGHKLWGRYFLKVRPFPTGTFDIVTPNDPE